MSRLFLNLFSLLCLATASLGAGLVHGEPGSTPYDSYLSPVKAVLARLDGTQPELDTVRELMHQGHSFAYTFTNPYVATIPEATARTRSGDCKDKALWLASKINDPTIQFVIGKASSSSKISHAWLLWQSRSRWFILDCTNQSSPVALEKVSSKEYIPYYSITRDGSYRYPAARLTAAQPLASKNNSPVAADRD